MIGLITRVKTAISRNKDIEIHTAKDILRIFHTSPATNHTMGDGGLGSKEFWELFYLLDDGLKSISEVISLSGSDVCSGTERKHSVSSNYTIYSHISCCPENVIMKRLHSESHHAEKPTRLINVLIFARGRSGCHACYFLWWPKW